MKTTYILYVLMFALAFASGCKSTDTTPEPLDYVEYHDQPYTPAYSDPNAGYVDNTVPDAPEYRSVTPDLLPDEGVYAPDIRGKSQEAVRSIKAEEFAKEVSDSVVVEERSGYEKTYLKVEFKFFDDADILERLVELFEQGSRDDNYVIEDKQKPNRKGYVYKVWSQKGRVNLERTIKNVLEYEDVRINLSNDNYMEITP